jgi:hypothetical protein
MAGAQRTGRGASPAGRARESRAGEAGERLTKAEPAAEMQRDGARDYDNNGFVEVVVQALWRRGKRGEGVGNDGERRGPFIVAGEGHAGARKGETAGGNGLNAIEGGAA